MNRIHRYAAVLGVVAAPFVASTAIAKTETAHSANQTQTTQRRTSNDASEPQWLDEAQSLRGLSADQRKQLGELRAQVAPARKQTIAAKKAFSDELAAQAKSGKVDRGALDPKIKAVIAAEDNEHAVMRFAVERLHAILDPKQRAALADAMMAREARYAERGVAPRLEQELRLTADQKKQLGSTIDDAKKPIASDAHAKDAAEFKQDKLSIDKVEPKHDATIQTRIDRLVAVVKDTARVARADQRATMAQVLRANGAAGRVAL